MAGSFSNAKNCRLFGFTGIVQTLDKAVDILNPFQHGRGLLPAVFRPDELTNVDIADAPIASVVSVVIELDL